MPGQSRRRLALQGSSLVGSRRHVGAMRPHVLLVAPWLQLLLLSITLAASRHRGTLPNDLHSSRFVEADVLRRGDDAAAAGDYAAAARNLPELQQHASTTSMSRGLAAHEASQDERHEPTRSPRIAVVNEASFHLEVVAGLIAVTAPLRTTTSFFLNSTIFPGKSFGTLGFLHWNSEMKCYTRTLPEEHLLTSRLVGDPNVFQQELHMRYQDEPPCPKNIGTRGRPPFDLLVLVSSERNTTLAAQIVAWARPQHVIVILHNGDSAALPKLQGLHTSLDIVTLSPHVSSFVASRLLATPSWVLPVRRVAPRWACAGDIPPWERGTSTAWGEQATGQVTDNSRKVPPASVSGHVMRPVSSLLPPMGKGFNVTRIHAEMAAAGATCLAGFAIQGALASQRRKYAPMWDQLDAAVRTPGSAFTIDNRFALQLFGKGQASRLGMPSHLRPYVQVFKGLRYADYYNAIHHTLALIPAFGNDVYYDRKFSSTVITSLITSTPIIADARILKAYR
mmetsp:Transcript_39711/g.118156  ORF Transcript_39711/g.118156 Transcript_39711/m.118156 type:complete len:507 (-) Transcript_39711:834-2354(-)